MLELEIPKGLIKGHISINKFGHADDFDTGDGEVTIWDGADDAGIAEMQYNYSTGADIDSISSSNDTDTQDYEIQGLDEDWNLHVQTVTATGQTLKALDIPLVRVFRIKNVGSTDNAGTVYVFEGTDGVTAGVPDTTADVRAVMGAGNNQTLMAIYTVPTGKTAYMTNWRAYAAGANKTADFDIYLKARPFGGVFQIKHHSSMNDGVQSELVTEYNPYNKFSAKTDIEMRATVLDVGITAAGVSASFDLILVDDDTNPGFALTHALYR